MGIAFSKPQAEFEVIKDEWYKMFDDIVKRGVFVGGIPVTQFETAFANYIGTSHGLGVANGTDALFLALKSLGIGPGDEVITACNTFVATVEAIHHTGARPVLVDCEPGSYLINLNDVKKAVNQKTKAIIPVHLYGQMVDLTELIPWAKERDIFVIEDSAQAAGAVFNGKRAGSWGVLGCFSFYPDKNLGALGDGGAIVTNSEELARTVAKLRNHGGDTKYQHQIPGFNSRLDPIQASALYLKLQYLNEWSQKRRDTAIVYKKYLGDLDAVTLPQSRPDESHVFHLYIIRVDAAIREGLRKHLQKKGVLTAVHYPLPVHQTEAFAYLGYPEGTFPVAEKYAQEIISLPMNIALTEEDVAFIASEIKAFLGKAKS